MSRQRAESFVFVKEEALPLRYRPLQGTRVKVRRHANEAHGEQTIYEEGSDFVVDYVNGTVRRTQDSRIPDWSGHGMYGDYKFDHTRYPDYSNIDYTVYADYEYAEGVGEAEKVAGNAKANAGATAVFSGIRFIDHTVRKLRSGQEVVYVVYGDSISTGGEASEPGYTYFGRFADLLMRRFPGGTIRIVNQAIGGETSEGGMQRVEKDVVPLKPDLVTIGYGMNDQNLYTHGNGVPLPEFERNIRHMVEALRRNGDCDIILVTSCEPNPYWQHTSGTMKDYADLLIRLGEEYDIGVADANRIWRQELAAGKTPGSLLLNNINHPNDYGHYLYGLAFKAMLEW